MTKRSANRKNAARAGERPGERTRTDKQAAEDARAYRARFLPVNREDMRERGWDYRLLFLSDHKTLTSTRGHDGDPVPYMLYDSRVDTKAGLPYTEKSGEKGPYVNSGVSLMSILFEK